MSVEHSTLSRLGQIAILAFVAACGSEPECEEAAMQCDGDVLQECGADGWEDLEDCAANGQMCHEEMGHCMDMSDTDDSGMSM